MPRRYTYDRTTHRHCYRCKEVKLHSEFGNNKNQPYGIQKLCKTCAKLESRERYYKDPSNQMHALSKRRSLDWGIEPATVEDIRAVLAGSECYYCGIAKEEAYRINDRMSIDHRTPLNRGGDNSAENMVLACETCNRAKHDMTEAEYYGWIAGLVARVATGRLGKIDVRPSGHPIHPLKLSASI